MGNSFLTDNTITYTVWRLKLPSLKQTDKRIWLRVFWYTFHCFSMTNSQTYKLLYVIFALKIKIYENIIKTMLLPYSAFPLKNTSHIQILSTFSFRVHFSPLYKSNSWSIFIFYLWPWVIYIAQGGLSHHHNPGTNLDHICKIRFTPAFMQKYLCEFIFMYL